ncbi:MULTISPECIES: Fe(3+) dicitrate ABC transporter substrate-binding protein [unclassified Exiguobacterium]|uniref:ABC transporter substrate-binding protein n=2 Tax=unclassified Exiguobacterium TaxID=2644629 RepID=UPI0003C3CADB|nr:MULTISPECIES: Fe(3+) dicitrate ABC transporter substrate-binding protein [unclassified Exiguobacterium]AHA29690.1 Fe3+-citrate ABC transporter substrate-binding protein [Exiguobacterium sp. MH3]MCQ4090389.1 Fe(3+) dicitrate ABC transporter substrate-binding protein [Exiguobacterium sp. LL15]
MRRKTWMTALTLLVLSSLMLAACSSQAEQSNEKTRTITHEAGKTKVPEKPKKVVALEFSFVDALDELGITPVGIAQENKTDVSGLLGKDISFTEVGTRQQPNLEVISSLQPDLIIGDFNRHKGIYKQLQEIAPTIILKSRNATYEENIDSFKTIAEAVGKTKQMDDRLALHEERLQAAKKKVDPKDDRKVMVGVFRADSLTAHGETSFDGELLEKIGIENAVTKTAEPTVTITLEQMVKWDPDVIFMAEADPKLLKEWKDNPLWNQITAVKNGEVYEVNRDLWTRYRGLDAAEQIVDEAIQLLKQK